MGSRRSRTAAALRAALVTALALSAGGGGVVRAAAVPAPARAASADDRDRLSDHTAYTMPGGHLELGVLALDVGVFDRLTVGTDTATWVTGAVLGYWIPNGHVKLGLLRAGPLALALRGGLYYARWRDDESGTAARLWSLPASLYLSLDLTPASAVHLEGSVVTLAARGALAVRDYELRGFARATTVQLGAMLEHRLGRQLALTLRARLQPRAQPVKLRGTSMPDAYTRAGLEADISPEATGPAWALIAGVAFTTRWLRLRLGAGYGSISLPSFGVALPGRGFVPDGNLSVRF